MSVSRSHPGSVSRVEEGFRCAGSAECSTSLIVKTHQVQRGKRKTSAEVNTGGWERESTQDERSQCFRCQRMRRKVPTTRPEQIIVPACINSNIGAKCTFCVPNVLLLNWKKSHTYYSDQQLKDLQEIYYFKRSHILPILPSFPELCVSVNTLWKVELAKKERNLSHLVPERSLTGWRHIYKSSSISCNQ